jgi:hypothetical protein
VFLFVGVDYHFDDLLPAEIDERKHVFVVLEIISGGFELLRVLGNFKQGLVEDTRVVFIQVRDGHSGKVPSRKQSIRVFCPGIVPTSSLVRLLRNIDLGIVNIEVFDIAKLPSIRAHVEEHWDRNLAEREFLSLSRRRYTRDAVIGSKYSHTLFKNQLVIMQVTQDGLWLWFRILGVLTPVVVMARADSLPNRRA